MLNETDLKELRTTVRKLEHAVQEGEDYLRVVKSERDNMQIVLNNHRKAEYEHDKAERLKLYREDLDNAIAELKRLEEDAKSGTFSYDIFRKKTSDIDRQKQVVKDARCDFKQRTLHL